MQYIHRIDFITYRQGRPRTIQRPFDSITIPSLGVRPHNPRSYDVRYDVDILFYAIESVRMSDADNLKLSKERALQRTYQNDPHGDVL